VKKRVGEEEEPTFRCRAKKVWGCEVVDRGEKIFFFILLIKYLK